MAFPQIDVLKRSFVNRFGSSENLRIFRAPGRVNLIGEHTDYNLGFVLPIAMEMACYAVAAPSGDNVIRFYSRDMDDTVEWPVDSTLELKPRGHWSDYPIGVAQQLIGLGKPLPPEYSDPQHSAGGIRPELVGGS